MALLVLALPISLCLGDLLQLGDLLVQHVDVLLNDVGQLLNLHRLVVKYGFPPDCKNIGSISQYSMDHQV